MAFKILQGKKRVCCSICIVLLLGVLRCTDIYQGGYSDRDAYEASKRIVQCKEELFSQLIFIPAEKDAQLIKGSTPKFVLLDQFQRRWVFKIIDPDAEGNAVPCYILGTLWGLDIPESHYAEVVINDETVRGIMVLYIDNAIDGLNNKFNKCQFSPRALIGVAKKEIFDFIVGATDISASNILFCGKERYVTHIYGLDMDLLDRSLLTFEAFKMGRRRNGQMVYAQFWQTRSNLEKKYIAQHIQPYLEYVSQFPEEYLRSIFGTYWDDHFIEAIVARKKNACAGFYTEFATKKVRNGKKYYLKWLRKVHEKELRKLYGVLQKKKKHARVQSRMQFVASWRVWQLNSMLRNDEISMDEYLKRLKKIEEMQLTAHEREAVNNAAVQIKLVNAGKIHKMDIRDIVMPRSNNSQCPIGSTSERAVL